MGISPYSGLPKSAFWKTGVSEENPRKIHGIYKKKFEINADTKIATAGSCFAQHISYSLKNNGYNVLDVEPPPPGLPGNLHQQFGYSMYSARYGNIYTVSQLLQLAQEAADDWTPREYCWTKDGKFVDALRPGVEPEGLDSPQEVLSHRKFHISRVKKLFESLDLFIFTLGLTEAWIHKESGTVYPSAPGAIAGTYNESLYTFKNFQFHQIIDDFNKFQDVLRRIRSGRSFKVLLTVSPVPLTATASGNHVLPATVYSKSILRSVSGELFENYNHIDYFPSYEIVTNPKMRYNSFSENLRSVNNEAVQIVMSHFFDQHPAVKEINKFPSRKTTNKTRSGSIQCEEALLEAFGE